VIAAIMRENYAGVHCFSFLSICNQADAAVKQTDLSWGCWVDSDCDK